MRILAIPTLLLASTLAHAGPILFNDASYATSAFAAVGSQPDIAPDGLSPPELLPLFSQAAVELDPEFAFADAIADDGLLVSGVEVMSIDQQVDAVAVSSFIGSFTGAGRFRLDLDFDSIADLAGAAAGARLFVTLTAGLDTLLDETFELAGDYRRIFDFGAMAQNGLLALDLVGDGSTLGGYAFALASVDFALQSVPEPTSVLLAATALAGLAAQRRARRIFTPRCDT
jgi:hypothetical protein